MPGLLRRRHPRYRSEVRREEALQMIANLTAAYAELLLKWAQEENEAA